jgi:retron-type reverse transcriptase
LTHGRYLPGPYKTFEIHHPKWRLISAAPFRDRVVHHALVNVLEPIWERTFIHDSYACRKGQDIRAALCLAELLGLAASRSQVKGFSATRNNAEMVLKAYSAPFRIANR